MPDQIRDVTHYSRYFNIEAPGSTLQAFLFVVLGASTGITANLFIHSHTGAALWPSVLTGISLGIIAITVPSILTVIFIKAMKRRIKLKHAFFAVLAISLLYSCFFIINASLFSLIHNYTLAYLVLIFSNACIYGYWFLINRVVMAQKRGQILTAAVQPVLNVLLFIPVSRYLFSYTIPFDTVLLKLISGMMVFMLVGYVILYIMDKPAKKALKVSGVDIITSMVNQWLYDITKDVEVFEGAGTKTEVKTDIIALRGGSGIKAVFVNPEIHYGPFHEVGGGVATEQIGKKIEEGLGAVPFVMHGAVNIQDNPVSTKQINGLSNTIVAQVKNTPRSQFKAASGSISRGSDGPCNAISLSIGSSTILTLTKAPLVTEDIDKSVGRHLTAFGSKYFKNPTLVDAHNSRIESAPSDELRGINVGSKYIRKYENAIRKAAAGAKGRSQLSFGAEGERLSKRLRGRDIGQGYTSVGVFGFGKRRFCMVYFDANNMLPGFREEIIAFIGRRFKMDAELYTTDTHSVNSIALPASNVLGRETKTSELIPILEEMIIKAIGGMEKVTYTYAKPAIKGFKVWGQGTDDVLLKVSREVIYAGKRKVPIIIAAGFIIAAWVIYLT